MGLAIHDRFLASDFLDGCLSDWIVALLSGGGIQRPEALKENLLG